MRAVGTGKSQLEVGLVAGRTLRAQCLARFLELSGLGIRIVALESIGPSLVGQIDALDLAIIDTGEQTCRDPEIRTGFTCLRDALPGIPVVVLSDREDWSAVIAALNLGAQAYFPSSRPGHPGRDAALRTEGRDVHTHPCPDPRACASDAIAARRGQAHCRRRPDGQRAACARLAEEREAEQGHRPGVGYRGDHSEGARSPDHEEIARGKSHPGRPGRAPDGGRGSVRNDGRRLE
jgi:hypothetical protein